MLATVKFGEKKKIISNTTFDLRIVPVFPFFENENQNSLQQCHKLSSGNLLV